LTVGERLDELETARTAALRREARARKALETVVRKASEMEKRIAAVETVTSPETGQPGGA